MTANQIAFLNAQSFAVAGASSNREKYGNMVFRALVKFTAEDDREVFPIHPTLEIVEGHVAFADISALQSSPEALSIVTPPPATRTIVDQAIKANVKHIWMQPGAEHPEAIAAAQAAGISVLANGPCILVALKTLV